MWPFCYYIAASGGSGALVRYLSPDFFLSAHRGTMKRIFVTVTGKLTFWSSMYSMSSSRDLAAAWVGGASRSSRPLRRPRASGYCSLHDKRGGKRKRCSASEAGQRQAAVMLLWRSGQQFAGRTRRLVAEGVSPPEQSPPLPATRLYQPSRCQASRLSRGVSAASPSSSSCWWCSPW